MKKVLLWTLIAFFGIIGGAHASGNEIEVEIFNDYSVVEWEIGNDEGEFNLDETDEADLIELIAEELDISVADVEFLIEFDYDDDSSSDDDESSDDEDDSDDDHGDKKSHICHEGKDLEVGGSLVTAHLAHGDTLGECGHSTVGDFSNLDDDAREDLIKEIRAQIQDLIERLIAVLLAELSL